MTVKDIDQLIEEELIGEDFERRVESSRRKGMPGPPKWVLAQKVQKHNMSHLNIVIGLTNLVVCCLVGLAVAIVVLELFR